MLTDMLGTALRKTLSTQPARTGTQAARAVITGETVAISTAARRALAAGQLPAPALADEAARVAKAATYVSRPSAARGAAIAEIQGQVPKALAELSRVEVNRIEGLAREQIVENRLRRLFPARKGYDVMREVYLRDESGRVAVDALSGGYRRVDFMVARGEQMLLSLEVTAQAEPGKRAVSKLAQLAKEARIRGAGGKFVQLPDGRLVQLPRELQTQVVRLK